MTYLLNAMLSSLWRSREMSVPLLFKSLSAGIKNIFILNQYLGQRILCIMQFEMREKYIGADQLDPHLLKLAAPIIARPLAHIFYLSLFSGQIPISPSGAITSRRKSKKI